MAISPHHVAARLSISTMFPQTCGEHMSPVQVAHWQGTLQMRLSGLVRRLRTHVNWQIFHKMSL